MVEDPQVDRGEIPGCDGAVRVFVAAAAKIGVALTALQQARFALYCGAILTVSEHTNVTGIRTPDGITTDLFLDSLTLLGALADLDRDSPTVVDVGSGAGIPGVPLAIVRPEWRFTLVESVGKKAAFIRAAADALALENLEVQAVRTEAYGRQEERDRFDVAVARAVASLPTLLELCAPLVRAGGVLVFPKSGRVEAEIRDAAPAALVLRLELEQVYPVPAEIGLGEGRAIVRYRKIGDTPVGYPRREGLARQRPIGVTPARPGRPRERSAPPR